MSEHRPTLVEAIEIIFSNFPETTVVVWRRNEVPRRTWLSEYEAERRVKQG